MVGGLNTFVITVRSMVTALRDATRYMVAHLIEGRELLIVLKLTPTQH